MPYCQMCDNDHIGACYGEPDKVFNKLELDRIFSGEYSRGMWDEINNAKTKGDLRRALYFVCCRLQELESKLAREIKP